MKSDANITLVGSAVGPSIPRGLWKFSSKWRRHGRNGPKTGTLMYPDRLQNEIDAGHGQLIFLICAPFDEMKKVEDRVSTHFWDPTEGHNLTWHVTWWLSSLLSLSLSFLLSLLLSLYHHYHHYYYHLKIMFYQYRKSRCANKTILKLP